MRAASSIEARPPNTIRRFVYSCGTELVSCGLSSITLIDSPPSSASSSLPAPSARRRA